ncbi:MAG TPA: phosphoenolpyruvate--protein phosphotransferase [Bacillota bacterium]|nr:phosphoenolpyruvate--protein phosphotransferase [Bacillota bacterium]
MKIIRGVGASGQWAAGRVVILKKESNMVESESKTTHSEEKERFFKARQKAESELDRLIEKLGKSDQASSQIFASHREMINDVILVDRVKEMIDRGESAEMAVTEACDHFYGLLSRAEDEYLRQRKDDVLDVKNRLMQALSQKKADEAIPDGSYIVFSERLFPSDIMNYSSRGANGFVSRVGSVYSHTSILARNMGIPYVCQLDATYETIKESEYVVIDGKSGEVYLGLDEKTAANILASRNKAIEKTMEDALSVTAERQEASLKIKIMANANRLEDIDLIKKTKASGIGLVRSEYLFAENEKYPNEEEQEIVYERFIKALAPLPVTIRTFDFSSDKPNRFRRYEKEENPALGYRGIRISLEEPENFKIQLRALLRASKAGNLRILFPMITGLSQVMAIKKILLDAKKELRSESKEIADNIEIGLMIETPAAALVADILAPEVDFFSLGTNDLIQYTLATDRQNFRTAGLYDENHPAVRKLMQMTCKAAAKARIPVAICGEMAENLHLSNLFLTLGINELSVSSGKVDKIRKAYAVTE